MSEDQEDVPAKAEFRLSAELCELAIGGTLLGGVVWYAITAVRLPSPFNPVDVGAGGFPKLLVVGAGIALVAMLVGALRRLATGQRRAPIVVARPPFVVLAAALLVGQAVLFAVIDPFLCVGLFGLLMMLACGERRPLHLVAVPIAIAGGIWLIFDLLLNVHFS